MANEKFEKGLKLRKQVLGAEYVEKSMASADSFSSVEVPAIREHG